jgi:hypothetical protein
VARINFYFGADKHPLEKKSLGKKGADNAKIKIDWG